MNIYSLLIGYFIQVEVKGRIWCTDGSIIDPIRFKESGKEAFGYGFTDNTLVRITKSYFDMELVDPHLFDKSSLSDGRSSYSSEDGLANCRWMMELKEYKDGIFPALDDLLSMPNPGLCGSEVHPYLPSIQELRNLYSSIVRGTGIMGNDLSNAGILRMCNYNGWYGESWGDIWSSTGGSYSMLLRYNGRVIMKHRSEAGHKARYIPFYRKDRNE